MRKTEKTQDQPEIVEPEKNFQNKLVNRWDELGYIIRDPDIPSSVKDRVCMTFIASLPNDEKNGVFAELYGNLENMQISDIGVTRNTRGTYIDVYNELTVYCGKVYFKNFSFIKPVHGSGEMQI